MLKDNDFTHIIWGYSAASTIKDAFNLSSNQIIICLDPITVGRQNLQTNFDLWEETRIPALEAALEADLAELVEPGELVRLFHNIAALDAGHPVLVWLDCSVASQLMAAFICHLFKSNDWDLGRLHVLSYAKTDELYMGIIGVLSEKKLLERRSHTKKMPANEVDQYAKIWASFAGTDLQTLLRVIQDKHIAELTMDSLPHLLRRLPSRLNGLNEIDHKLLKHAITQTPRAAYIIGMTLGNDESPDMVGDMHLFARLKRFGSPCLKHPLFEVDNPSGPMRQCRIDILPLAHEVLAGRANMIDLNGLDDWLGGVHLTPDNFIYREDIAAT